MKSCLIIAGEKSGEDHAMSFLPELRHLQSDCLFWGVGGKKLRAQGVETLYDTSEFSGIGISEVLAKIPFYYRAMDRILTEVKRRETRVAILIDFQGFNLKLAKKLKKQGVMVLYYVAPQAWAWKEWRVKALQESAHTLFTIIPFEKQWFRERGVSKTKSVIHPLALEHAKLLQSVRPKDAKDFAARPVRILLLPGSRRTEIANLLDIFEQSIAYLQKDRSIEVAIAQADSVDSSLFQTNLDYTRKFKSDDLHEALSWADMAIAASGTVTLTCGLYAVPTVVCYKLSLMTELILKLFVRYKGPVSLSNIVHQKFIFPELIQADANPENIAKHLSYWIENPSEYNGVSRELEKTKNLLEGDDFSVSEYMDGVIKSAYEK